MTAFTGFPAAAWEFLDDLAANNTSDHFNRNREQYRRNIATPATTFVDALTPALQRSVHPALHGDPRIGALAVPDQPGHAIRARQDSVQDVHRLPVLDRQRRTPALSRVHHPPHKLDGPCRCWPDRSRGCRARSVSQCCRRRRRRAASRHRRSAHHSGLRTERRQPRARPVPAPEESPECRSASPGRIPSHPHRPTPRRTRR